MRSKWLIVAGAVLLVGLGVAVSAGRDTYETARIGTAYVAKQTCSCLFVAGRSMDSCRTDFDADAIEPLTFEVAGHLVTVSALAGFVSTTAQFAEGFGCHPVN